MSWIDDAAKKARDEDDDRSRREKAYERELSGLWNNLVTQIKEDIQKINANKDLVSRRLGGNGLRFLTESENEFTVEKRTVPGVTLQVTNNHTHISAQRDIVTKAGRRPSIPITDRIDVELDENYHLFLTLPKSDSEPLSVAAASQRLLEPFFVRSQ